MYVKPILFFITAIICLSACSPYVQIENLEIALTDSTVITNIDLIEHRDQENMKDTLPNGGRIFPVMSAGWFNKLEKVCKKNKVTHNYTIQGDTSAVSLELIFTDPKRIRSFLEDFGLARQEVSKAFDFHFYVVFTQKPDSTHLSINYKSSVFTSSSYIAIETPTRATTFYPKQMTADSLRPELIAANKSYFYADNEIETWHTINCSYKNNQGALPSIKASDDQINLFGYSQNSWMFWCTIIGTLAAIFGIVTYFIKKS